MSAAEECSDDLQFPSGAGPHEVARRVRSQYPRLPIPFVPGCADRALPSGISKSPIGKPFHSHMVAERIALALDRRAHAKPGRSLQG